MRLDAFLDSLHVLGTLWGTTPPQVCASNGVQPSTTIKAPWFMARGASTGIMAFVNVNVVPMDTERVLANHTVLVENGLITRLGPAAQIKVAAGAVRIDGRGKYLIPGLADMHAHQRNDFVFSGRALRELTGLTNRAMHDVLFGELASGITTIRYTTPVSLDRRKAFRDSMAAGGPSPEVYFAPEISRSTPLASIAQSVATAKADGYDFIQVPNLERRSDNGRMEYTSQARMFLDSLVTAAHRESLPISSHIHDLPFDMFLRLGSLNRPGFTGGSNL